MRVENYRVVEASPESGVTEIIQRSNFDVVLLGIAGPYRSALALLRTIKETRPFTEVILLTAVDEHSLYGSIQAMELGAFDDLLVPLDINTLHRRIEEAYQKKKEQVKAKRSATRGARRSRSPGQAAPCGQSTCKPKEIRS